MSLVPLDRVVKSESPEHGHSDRLLRLFAEIADLAHLYSNRINIFLDHGYGQLSLAIDSERNGPISIRVERLSADLEQEKETIVMSHAEVLGLICGFFSVSPEIVLGLRKRGATEREIAGKTVAKLKA
jgi:hypothetical protein